jgi:hypothetical protein
MAYWEVSYKHAHESWSVVVEAETQPDVPSAWLCAAEAMLAHYGELMSISNPETDFENRMIRFIFGNNRTVLSCQLEDIQPYVGVAPI